VFEENKMTVTVISEKKSRVVKPTNILGYSTEYYYTSKYTRYSSYIIATNKIEAKKLLKQRNLPNEKIVSCRYNLDPNALIIKPSSLTEKELKRNMIDILHDIAFLSFLATRTGKLKPDTVLSDIGVLHETIHWFSFVKDPTINIENLRRLFEILENATVGVFAK
jgi:hypothetical protein